MHPSIERYGNLIEKLLPGKASFSPFACSPGEIDIHQRVDGVGQVFMQGCREALAADTLDSLFTRLNSVEAELRGFAFEGAGMGLALFDHLNHEETERLPCFAAGQGTAYSALLSIGAGWTLARTRQPLEACLARLDPVSGWLIADGYGFHEGYTSPGYREQQLLPRRLRGYALRVFDQGLGRSLWFVYAAEIAQIAATISAFTPSRQKDLWSGIGLACAYTGIVERAVLEQFRQQAGNYASYIAQGVAVAAWIRQQAGNSAPHTDLACQVFCASSATQVVNIAELALENLASTEEKPAYEDWQQRIHAHFA